MPSTEPTCVICELGKRVARKELALATVDVALAYAFNVGTLVGAGQIEIHTCEGHTSLVARGMLDMVAAHNEAPEAPPCAECDANWMPPPPRKGTPS